MRKELGVEDVFSIDIKSVLDQKENAKSIKNIFKNDIEKIFRVKCDDSLNEYTKRNLILKLTKSIFKDSYVQKRQQVNKERSKYWIPNFEKMAFFDKLFQAQTNCEGFLVRPRDL